MSVDVQQVCNILKEKTAIATGCGSVPVLETLVRETADSKRYCKRRAIPNPESLFSSYVII